MAECSVTTPLTALRREIRKQSASFQECFDFMKTFGIKQDETGAAKSLRSLTYLRNELSLGDAVTFLKMYLDWLGENSCQKNLMYIIEICFLLADDLVELLRIPEAQEEYKRIVEWITKYGPCKTAEALAVSKLAVLACRSDSKREGQKYCGQCLEILKSVMEQIRESRYPMPDVQLKFVMNAFVSCGDYLSHIGQNDSARKCFLNALEFCPKNGDAILNRGSIYAQIYRIEVFSKDFEYLRTNTPHREKAMEHFEMLLNGETPDMNEMTQYMRTINLMFSIQDYHRTLLNDERLRRSISTQEKQGWALSRTQYLHDHLLSMSFIMPRTLLWRGYTSKAYLLAFCALAKFHEGRADYITFKELAEKMLAESLRKLDQNPKVWHEVVVNNFRNALFLMVQLCLLEKNFDEARNMIRGVLNVFNSNKSVLSRLPFYELTRGVQYYWYACSFYYLRGNVSRVKLFCKLVLKYCENRDDVDVLVLLSKRLLESINALEREQ